MFHFAQPRGDIMKFKKIISLAFLCLLTGLLLPASNADASEAIAKITRFKGDVAIISGKQIYTLTDVDTNLYSGDLIQTQQGSVEVTFNDGAIMNIQPFCTTMIQEEEEAVGWFARARRKARRVSVFVGKIWFKSGRSKRKNYLQTPTAVCGFRGTHVFIGFDNVVTYIDFALDEIDITGEAKTGVFGEIGRAAAQNNKVWNLVFVAWVARIAYDAAPTDELKKELNIFVLHAIQATLVTLLGNEHLSDDARLTLITALDEVNKDLEQLTGTTSSTTTTTTTTTSTTEESATTTTVYGG